MKNIKCDSCDHSMKDDKTKAINVGASFHLPKDGNSEFKRSFKMFGREKFSFCYCCLIKALGIKPIKNKK